MIIQEDRSLLLRYGRQRPTRGALETRSVAGKIVLLNA